MKRSRSSVPTPRGWRTAPCGRSGCWRSCISASRSPEQPQRQDRLAGRARRRPWPRRNRCTSRGRTRTRPSAPPPGRSPPRGASSARRRHRDSVTPTTPRCAADDLRVGVEQRPQPVGAGLAQLANGSVGRRLVVRYCTGREVPQPLGVGIPGRSGLGDREGYEGERQEQEHGRRAELRSHGSASLRWLVCPQVRCAAAGKLHPREVTRCTPDR